MTDWGRQAPEPSGLDIAADVGSLGPPLDVINGYNPQPAICLDDGRTRIIAVAADPPPRS